MSDCGDLLAWSPKLRKDNGLEAERNPEDILPPSGPGYKGTAEGTGAPGEGEPGVSKSRNVQGTFREEDRQNFADGWGQKGPWRAHGRKVWKMKDVLSPRLPPGPGIKALTRLAGDTLWEEAMSPRGGGT